MNDLVRLDPAYRLYELPKLKYNSFLWNGQIGYTGSLIKRPMKNSLGIYKHYGFIYGFDENETLLVIENNSNGVECISFRDFLSGNTKYIIEHNFYPDTCELIMIRAFEKAEEFYHTRENNCEAFVNYCLYGKLESSQVKVSEALANLALTALEIRVAISPSLEDHEILEDLNEMRKSFKLERSKEIQEQFDKRRKRLESLSKKTKLKIKNRFF